MLSITGIDGFKDFALGIRFEAGTTLEFPLVIGRNVDVASPSNGKNSGDRWIGRCARPIEINHRVRSDEAAIRQIRRGKVFGTQTAPRAKKNRPTLLRRVADSGDAQNLIGFIRRPSRIVGE